MALASLAQLYSVSQFDRPTLPSSAWLCVYKRSVLCPIATNNHLYFLGLVLSYVIIHLQVKGIVIEDIKKLEAREENLKELEDISSKVVIIGYIIASSPGSTHSPPYGNLRCTFNFCRAESGWSLGTRLYMLDVDMCAIFKVISYCLIISIF